MSNIYFIFTSDGIYYKNAVRGEAMPKLWNILLLYIVVGNFNKKKL